jgi:HD-GYP domain-containing protein (c-di-GMP phosphodiesterase class II)
MVGAIYIGFIDTAIIDTLFYGWILFILFAKNLTFRQRALGTVIPIWLLAIYLILRFGMQGAGFLWLLAAPVLTGILMGLKEGVVALVLTAIALFLLSIFIYNFDIFPAFFGEQSALYWSVISGNTIVLIALIMVSSSIMIQALSNVIERLDRKVQELSDTEDATIETFATLAECRDTDTGYHISRTKMYVEVIARTLQKRSKYQIELSDEYIELLSKSAPLHDIGKIGIPDKILLKKGKLTPEEMEIMKRHTVYGRNALLQSEKKLGSNSFLHLAAEIAYTHQERWNGSGYPQGLKGEEIPLSGRIMAIADVYDALRSERPYKEKMDHEEAIGYLQKHSGILFDPEIISLLPELEKKFAEIYEREDDENRCSLVLNYQMEEDHPIG